MNSDFERDLGLLEQWLAALGEALGAQDTVAIERHAAELQCALDALRRNAAGALPPTLRPRLARAGARVQAQRDALARAGAATDRALLLLLPPSAPRAAYSNAGLPERGTSAGCVTA